MTERRINKETGLFEEWEPGVFGLGGEWVASKNENGRDQRLSPEDGTLEEYDPGLIFGLDSGWRTKR